METDSQTPPSGYSVYVYTSVPAGTVTLPDVVDGQICYVINNSGGTITINYSGGAYGMFADRVAQFFYYDGTWYLFVNNP